MNLDAAYDYCRRIAHKHGANFSVGFRFLPLLKRRAVYAAYAFCRVADDIADEDVVAIPGEETDIPKAGDSAGLLVTGPSSGLRPPSPRKRGEGTRFEIRRTDEGPVITASPALGAVKQLRTTLLDEWQNELEACFAGQPSHPITIALGHSLQHFAIPKSAFVALIDGCRLDMVKTRYETFGELLHYCALVAASISDISLSIFGYRSHAAIEYGRNLSTALQLTNVTRDIGDDLTRDRIYVPQEDLRRFHVAERELFERAENERVRAMIEFQIDRAESYFRAAEPLLAELSWDARFPTLLMGGIYATVLAKLRKDPLLPIRYRLSLTPLQKIMVVGSRVLHPHFV